MSKELREFLQAYLYWAISGNITGENPHNFDKGCGMCSNIFSYRASGYERHYLKCELSELLENSGLDSQYPFGRDEYMKDMYHATHHLNQRRLDWIKARLCEQEQA